jgi:hypothetical protein
VVILTTGGQLPSSLGANSSALSTEQAEAIFFQLTLGTLVGVAGTLLAILAACAARYKASVECSRRPIRCARPKADAGEKYAAAQEEKEGEEGAGPQSDAPGPARLAADDPLAGFFEHEEFVSGLDDLPTLVVNPVMIQTQEMHKRWEQREKMALAGAVTARRSTPESASPGAPVQQSRRGGAFNKLHLDIVASEEDAGNHNLARLKKLEDFLRRQEGVEEETAPKEPLWTEAGRKEVTALSVAQSSDPLLRQRRRASCVADSSSVARQHVSKSLPAPSRLPPPSGMVMRPASPSIGNSTLKGQDDAPPMDN